MAESGTGGAVFALFEGGEAGGFEGVGGEVEEVGLVVWREGGGRWQWRSLFGAEGRGGAGGGVDGVVDGVVLLGDG